eukprot:g3922.t1
MFGLTSTVSTSDSYKDITNAIFLQDNGHISIRESSSNKGQMAKYNANSVFEVVVNSDGYPMYKVDGKTVYTSCTQAAYPLYVDGSFHDTGSELINMKWGKTGNSNLGDCTDCGAGLIRKKWEFTPGRVKCGENLLQDEIYSRPLLSRDEKTVFIGYHHSKSIFAVDVESGDQNAIP